MMTDSSTPQSEQGPLKRGTWSPAEDKKLIAYINRYGIWNWNEMPKAAGLSRSGKSCRLRWMNYLRPNIKRGNFTREEDQTIINLHESLGNKWSTIAARLPGRTDNEIKNYWHTHLKKLLKNSIQIGHQLQQMNKSEADVSNSSCTTLEASCSERSNAISVSSKSFSTVDSSTNSHDRITEEDVRLTDLPEDPLKSLMGQSSSSCNPDCNKNDERESREVSGGEVQSWGEQPFSSEELEILENYGTRDPVQMWLQGTIYPHATRNEYDIDFWMNF